MTQLIPAVDRARAHKAMRKGTLILLLSGLMIALVFAALRVLDPGPVRDLRLTYFDYLQRVAPREPVDVPVRIIDIDEATLAVEGQWPWPRDRLADLQDRLTQAGAAVVVYDILFAEPDRLSPHRLLGGAGEGLKDTDQIFAQSLTRVPSVLGTARSGVAGAGVVARAGFVEVGNAPRDGLPKALGFTPLAPGLAQAAAAIGAISISAVDGGGVVRTLPLVWSGPDGLMPSLPIEAIRLATGETTLTLYGAADIEASLEGIAIGSGFVPTTPAGELWLHYRRDDPESYVSAGEVLSGDPAAWADKVQGHIVLVGTSAAGLLDIRTTALGDPVPGVSIHAQAIEQVLAGDFLRRSDAVAGAELVTVLLVCTAVTLAMAFFGPLVAVLVGLSGLGVVIAGSLVAFNRYGTLFDAGYPMIAAGLTFAALAAYRLVVVDAERRAIRRSFSHYVAPEVLAEVERQGHRLSLGGETRDVTVLFSDVRGFTPLAESLPADQLVALLNSLFDAFGQEIMASRGTIDKFIGDAVMAFWNAPIEMEDHPECAVAAGLAMHRALDVLNAKRETPIRAAIGIATGPASVGNIGSKDRFNYSVVGHAVNLAARVEAACRDVHADMLVTAAVAEAAPGYAYLDAGALHLKGVSGRVPVKVVVGGKDLGQRSDFIALAEAQADFAACLAQQGGKPSDADALAADAEALFPGLGAFVLAMPGRRDDYQALLGV